ncbi:HlyD family secretion protein [Aporhodopirellula aestuarii]|uniref:HlyD family efflux transporter periplasmic adaptor subunit n=1 Tax=Aporhodopirellula aestuarii TaxID=2950107 RepID=A0ABT0TZW0_9BACT|nr:HlyD family efflux transporter periplasmic adaptor subunit [Aporhodopirellula aestuarii]MCM2370157.1 HlyD family efflux transporter periplasmic adaptor subunit [Aporhodopirellula aestuarii]
MNTITDSQPKPADSPETTTRKSSVQADPKRRRRRAMILPEAYDERAMPSLKLTRSSKKARMIGRTLVVLIVIGFIVVAIAPWQQSVKGSGSVIAFSPRDRTQTIESPTKGRIVSFGEGIYENAHVTEGEVIVEIRDLDESYYGRLQSQLNAGQEQIRSLESVVAAGRRNLVNAETMVETLQAQLRSYESVKEQIIASADASVEASIAKVVSQEQKLAEVKATLTQARADYERQRTLFNERIASELKFQTSEQKFREAEAKLAQAEADLDAAKAALDEKRRDRNAKEQKAQADIEYARSTLNKAQSDVSKAESDIAKATSELNKSQKDLLDIETKLARQSNQTIRAPFDGYLTQIVPNLGSAVLKEGDPICVIVPDTADRAVQIWLDGNDAPLVSPGRHVRLQFEGWPAVQFAGWPSVAVGTFGGEVVSVDATDNGKGKFRVLVRPEDMNSWPEDRYLRQGVRANAWVLINRVPLWFEIWRNMNGFPPMIDDQAKETTKSKPPKVKI